MKVKAASFLRIALVKRWLQVGRKKAKNWPVKLMGMGVGIVGLLLMLVYGSYLLAYRNKVYPGVRVAGVALGNNSIGEVMRKLDQLIIGRGVGVLPVVGNDKIWELQVDSVGLKYDIEKTALAAFRVGREELVQDRLTRQWQAWFEGMELPLEYEISEEALVEFVAQVAAEIDRPVVPPTLVIEDAGKPGQRVGIKRGENGLVVDQELWITLMIQRLEWADFSAVAIPVREQLVQVTESQLEATRQRAEKLVETQITLESDEQTWSLGGKELIEWLDFEGGWDEVRVASYAGTLADAIDRPAQNAAFRFENNRVVEFRPGKDGLRLDQEKTKEEIVAALDKLEAGEEQGRVNLSLIRTKPAISTDQVNSFGIKELLGRGVSTYRGSIASRVHNVGLSAQRISGTLIPPGETFSFNQVVGEISDQTGYQQAYVIRSGRTVLDDGGGVCQTSTTLFRAVMETGLPITERKSHSYRVGYYEQNAKVGLDATVFAPTADFKFVNDTPAHILVQTIVNAPSRTLTVEIYGTSDGRKGQTVNHKIWDQIPPPPDLYQDDPSVPAGQVKQVDWSAWGAKVKFDYVVTRGGETIFSKTFYQVYQPWQAIFLRGTGG
ncbi:MAG: VanW family protein [Candidatus Chisholmbacteria bacterium]|nr:VanW family protein [Candidatus Chisholmbacteria bacterium]